mgnify:CR=1 FL=1
MSNKPMKISESAAVQMPMKTVASLIVMVAMGVFAYRIEDMMHNKVNIEFLQKQTEKLLEDVEELKDKVRANGSAH